MEMKDELAKIGPFRVDRIRVTPIHSFIVRDRRNRQIATINPHLHDREELAEVIVQLLNTEGGHHGNVL